MSGSDTEAAQTEFAVAVSETVTGLDDQIVSLVFFADQDETVNASSTEAAVYTTSQSVNESISGSNVGAAQVDFAAAVSETVQTQDINAAGAIFVASLLEQFTPADTCARRLLWELIDNNQIPPPVPATIVNAFSSVSMSDLSMSGGPETVTVNLFAWPTINNGQNAGWGLLDTDAPTTWEKIDTI